MATYLPVVSSLDGTPKEYKLCKIKDKHGFAVTVPAEVIAALRTQCNLDPAKIVFTVSVDYQAQSIRFDILPPKEASPCPSSVPTHL